MKSQRWLMEVKGMDNRLTWYVGKIVDLPSDDAPEKVEGYQMVDDKKESNKLVGCVAP